MVAGLECFLDCPDHFACTMLGQHLCGSCTDAREMWGPPSKITVIPRWQPIVLVHVHVSVPAPDLFPLPATYSGGCNGPAVDSAASHMLNGRGRLSAGSVSLAWNEELCVCVCSVLRSTLWYCWWPASSLHFFLGLTGGLP